MEKLVLLAFVISLAACGSFANTPEAKGRYHFTTDWELNLCKIFQLVSNTFSVDNFDHFFDQSAEPVEERQKRETNPCKQWSETIRECRNDKESVRTCCKEKNVPENCLRLCKRRVKIGGGSILLKPNQNSTDIWKKN